MFLFGTVMYGYVARYKVIMAVQSLVRSFIDGVFDMQTGERYRSIMRYFFPEFVTALILSSILNCIDAYFISFLGSASRVATVTVSSMLIQLIMKVAEGLSVGTIILGGSYNGQKAYRSVGYVFSSSFWTTVLIGGTIAGALALGAWPLCYFFNIPDDMLSMTVSFLQLRSIGIFFLFVFFAITGFLRAIKDARAPMYFFVLGSCVFVLVDYVCIFGAWGFPAYGMHGSAIAFISQYVVMCIASLCYILWHPKFRVYAVHIMPTHPFAMSREIIGLSWPVMLDKATLAGAKTWLVRLIGPLGTVPLASFGVIKDLEQLAFVPAIALAQVITFLASNDYGSGRWRAIKSNVKKVVMLASCLVFGSLLLLSMYPHIVMSIFDSGTTFGDFAARAFPYISILVFCDLMQLILAGALRGASQVRLVMRTRLAVGICIFIPLSLACAAMPIANTCVQFILIYGSFYVANGVMSIVYIWKFRTFTDTENVQPASHIKEEDGTYYPRRSPETGRDLPDSR